MSTSEAVIDLAAIRSNVAHLCSRTDAAVMAVVKADGYGHGLVPSARAALDGGATWLGVAQLDEALALRAAGIDAPTLAWLWAPDETETLHRALDANVDVSVSALWALERVEQWARRTGRTARVHLKIDTGLSRNGAYVDDWPALVEAAARAEARGHVRADGVWSHFAYADAPGHPTITAQIENFEAAVDGGPRRRPHAVAAPPGQLRGHLDPARGPLRPRPPGRSRLRPEPGARSARAGTHPGHDVAQPRRAEQARPCRRGRLLRPPVHDPDTTPGWPSSRWATPTGSRARPTNVGPLQVDGRRVTVSGRVCMDQFVVDVGQQPAPAGSDIILFGPGADGEPTAQDWADAVDTIHYEIVTRIGARVPRRYVGAAPDAVRRRPRRSSEPTARPDGAVGARTTA